VLEGKAKITLTDVRTGKEEVHEQHNLVTNAVKQIYTDLICGNQVPNTFLLPLSTKGLGGMFLFDEVLTESVDNVCLPSNSHVIGYCDRTTSTTVPYMGSLTSETGEIQNGFKNVWEFTTAQCNGTIKALSLTNSNLLTLSQNINILGSSYGKTVKYEDGYFYSIDFVNNTTCNVYKFPSYLNGFKVNTTASSRSVTIFKTITVPNFAANSNNISVGNNGYAYVTHTNGSTISYFTIKISDLSFDVSSLSTITLSGISFSGGHYPQYINGYFYATKSTGKELVKVDINQIEQPIEINMSNLYFNYSCKPVYNKGNGLCAGIAFPQQQQFYGYLFLLYPDNTYIVFNEHLREGDKYISGENLYNLLSGSIYNCRYNHTYDDANGMPLIRDYLGTICNLETPIVKDNTKTMKIEYSIIDT